MAAFARRTSRRRRAGPHHLALPVSAAMRRDQVDEVVAAVRHADLG
jgi:hypothetical protein